MINPYTIGGVALLLVATGGAGFHFGQKYSDGQWSARELATMTAVANRAVEQGQADDALAKKVALRMAQTQNAAQSAREALNAYRLAHTDIVCLDNDGLRVWNAQNRHSAQDASSGASNGSP